MACISAWIRWSTDNKCDGRISSVHSNEKLQTPAGAAQILYWSTRKTSQLSLAEIAELIGGDQESADKVFDFYEDLNFSSPELEAPAGAVTNNESADVSIDDAYRVLAQRYNLSLDQISAMTPVQQIKLLKVHKDATPVFATEEDYYKWLTKQ